MPPISWPCLLELPKKHFTHNIMDNITDIKKISFNLPNLFKSEKNWNLKKVALTSIIEITDHALFHFDNDDRKHKLISNLRSALDKETLFASLLLFSQIVLNLALGSPSSMQDHSSDVLFSSFSR